MFIKLPARSPPRPLQRRPQTPLGAPKDAPRGPNGGPRAPQRPPRPPRRRSNIKPLAAPGRPRSRPRGLRRPFWDDVRPSGPTFVDFSNILVKTRQTTQTKKPRYPRDSIATQRWVGGVLPTWPPGSLRGAIFEPPEPPGRASGRLREPPVSDTQRHFATWQPQFSDTPRHFATSQPHFKTKGAGGMGAKPFR